MYKNSQINNVSKIILTKKKKGFDNIVCGVRKTYRCPIVMTNDEYELITCIFHCIPEKVHG